MTLQEHIRQEFLNLHCPPMIPVQVAHTGMAHTGAVSASAALEHSIIRCDIGLFARAGKNYHGGKVSRVRTESRASR